MYCIKIQLSLVFILITILTFTSCKTQNKITKEKDDYLVVETKNGKVRGREVQTIAQQRTYYAFQSIPYAQPPLDDLRFRPPVPAKPWKDILDARNDLTPCVQSKKGSVIGSEDCLYLTVYTPKISNKKKNLMPVMVWIHGGGFIEGNAKYSLYNPDYFIMNDIVVVSMHYRLGVFGFLSTDDLASPGNYGLKDQVLALKWIKDNIKNFGGNPKKITLFGSSAGSASVSYHLMSSKSKDLFQRAIMESGTSLFLWSLSRRSLKAADLLRSNLNISSTSHQDWVDGLRKIDHVTLQKAAKFADEVLIVESNPRNGLNFGPVREASHEDAFFDGKSHEMLKQGNFNRLPAIIGFNSMEAGFNISFIERLFLHKYDKDLSLLVPIDLNLNSTKKKIELGIYIKLHYFGFFPMALQTKNVIEFMSDDQFVRPVVETVRLQSKYAPVYFYRFSYNGTLGGFSKKVIPGAVHSEEIPYFWPSKNIPTNNDLLVSARMIKMWTNFAKFGDPTPEADPLFNNIHWPVANSKPNGLVYLNIDEELKVDINPQNKNITFWNKVYKDNGIEPYDTY